jgi:hypothetical protein
VYLLALALEELPLRCAVSSGTAPRESEVVR